MIKKISSGFSLIELLVVISIIGILVGLSIFSIGSSRAAARDARRKADIETIRAGLELYKADCGDYPDNTEFPAVNADLLGDGSPSSCAGTNNYIDNRPGDVLTGWNYRYWSPILGGSAVSYEMCIRLENGSGSVSCGNPPSSACGGGSCNYRVTSP